MTRGDDDRGRDGTRRGHHERAGDARSSRPSSERPDAGLGHRRDGDHVGVDPASVEDDEQPPDALLDAHETWAGERREAMGMAIDAEENDDEVELPYVLERAGEFGVGVALFGLLLSLFGVGAASLNVQPLGNVSMFFSLVLVAGAMVLAVIIRAYRADFSLPSRGT